jgi:mannose-1-phosphate guanylyltransferase/mannose-6-phosphate isomerase
MRRTLTPPVRRTPTPPVRRTLTPALRRHLHAVVLAGGAGQRFWPRSRKRHPKPLLRALDGRSLLSATLDRAARFAAPGAVWLVCARDHAQPMRREAGLPAARTIVEPVGRNTAMAIGVAATRIAAEDPEALLAALPADHVIHDARALALAVGRAARAAAEADVLVALGVQPRRPETGYGYLRVGAPAPRHAGLRRVARFVEKPDAARARRYASDGRHLWNAGIFVARARTLLEEIERHAPDVHHALAPVRRRPRGPGSAAALESAYRAAPSVSVDVAVLERSRRLWTLPVDFHWNDVGTWDSLARELGVGGRESRIVGGSAIFEDAAGNLVWGDGRLVVLLGVEELAVIDSPDALLVARLDRSPELKRVVERLARERGELV